GIDRADGRRRATGADVAEHAAQLVDQILRVARAEELAAAGQRCMPGVVDVGGDATARTIRVGPTHAATGVGQYLAQVARIAGHTGGGGAIGVVGNIQYAADAQTDQVFGHVRP